MNTQPLRFIRGGEVVTLNGIEPNRTLLEVLREDMHCTGTKEGCGEGDCGACTVVLGQADGEQVKYSAVNSCIRLAHSIDGMALWTVEDLAQDDGSLHPAQEAMVECHGSQCGFCTPGFVMSMFGMYQNKTCKGQAISREEAQAALSGNLCRCTGYRPILDATQAMQALPLAQVNEAELLLNLELLAQEPRAPEANSTYQSPQTLLGLLQARAQFPDAQLVAGCTDVGLWITKMHMQFPRVLDTTQVAELRRIEDYPHHIAIGAAATLTDAFAALVADRPQLTSFAHRFAGLPVRNSGTLGGNVANGSPIGDSMPLLIALQANVVLMAYRKGKVVHREMPLEDLYISYRKNVMAPDEVLAWIKVPKATAGEKSAVYKISKRFEDDISAVCLAINLQIDNGVVTSASIGAGGVAATPVRARKTQAALLGQPWTPATVQAAMAVLRAEFTPISDVRASAAYRTQVLGNLLQRFWLESQGLQQIDLHSLPLEGEAA
ncbi:xanthine dehydrogenase small subunit [Rhodoferax aquaticus]|uniref:Xanthine dehydrogenase small subunit n=1 Tax=Rhodoferax aquaticus TaxID=2527691 RepID=A0A515EMF9_9BURK|nr:xanthine dehydrogenase small subunit [Rhodoferax aquaticus]QDL53838.1 xanthine dehydrogenase small subunit [Rhodoferax aquaticus]